MVIDSYNIPEGRVIDADLCIVGGGMVGIAMARDLKRSGLRIALLESGGKEFEGPSQALYEGTGELSGEDTASRDIRQFVVSSRFRQLGGAGNKWGGKCGIPDEEVFEKRSWIPNSGWPFRRASLMPFYDQACDVLEIDRFGYDERETHDPTHPTLAVSGKDRITTSTRHISLLTGRLPRPDPFRNYLSGAADDPNVDLYLHANVVDIVTNESGTAVTSVQVSTLRRNRFSVRAKQFVLATGGIENARLLLHANRQEPEGIGNQNGLVGRYFSGHMTLGGNSRVYFSNLAQSLLLYTGRNSKFVWGVLKTAKELQAKHQLPNFTVSLNPGRPKPSESDETILKAAYLADGRLAKPDLEGFGLRAGGFVAAYFMSEQAPNPESRVTLTEERDALGLRRINLDWKFTSSDLDAAMASTQLFAQEMGAMGLGRMKPVLTRGTLLATAGISRHHVGATRMDADPKRGVVDIDCKVHGVENLYIAGSSVFPTAGIVNPTLTIIALGLKLSGHLRNRI